MSPVPGGSTNAGATDSAAPRRPTRSMGSGRPSAVRTRLDHGLHLCHEFRIGPCGLQVADGAPGEADWDHGEPEAADDHQGRIDVGSGCGEARAADQQHDNATDRDDRAARDGREPSGRLGLDQGPAAPSAKSTRHVIRPPNALKTPYASSETPATSGA